MKIVSTDNIDIDSILHYFNEDPVVIPTETVYGLAAPIDNEHALRRIFELKGRPVDNPLIIHVSSINMLMRCIDGDIPDDYKLIIDKYWPGPISLLFKANKSISKIVTANLDTVLIRMPDNKVVLEIIEKLNVPLAAPSANISGRPSPSTISHVVSDFKDKVSLYIDGGQCKVGLESTVISCLGDKITILRPGYISKDDISLLLNREVILGYMIKDKPVCPGQKYKHYSPKNKMILVYKCNVDLSHYIAKYGKEYCKIGILMHPNVIITEKFDNINFFDLGTTPLEISSNLFKGVRALDSECDVIITCLVADNDAIMDRLKKAAHHIIYE